MTRKITASVLALGITLNGLGAAPAHAGKNNGINQFIAGAITALIVNEVIKTTKTTNTNTSRRVLPPVSVTRPNAAPIVIPPGHRGVVPGECFFNIRTERGSRGVYGKICLNEEMRRANHLPKVCEDTVRIRYGLRSQVYDAKCLRKRGYQVEARLN